MTHIITYNHQVDERFLEINVRAILQVMNVPLPAKLIIDLPTGKMEITVFEK